MSSADPLGGPAQAWGVPRMHEGRPTILLVEDDPDHQILIALALNDPHLGVQVRSTASGEMALLYLLGMPPFDDANQYPRPVLVILDLNLPGMSGFDVLRAIRESRELRFLPVLVLAVSGEDLHRRRALELGATAFQTKPADFSSLFPIVRELLRDGRGSSIA